MKYNFLSLFQAIRKHYLLLFIIYTFLAFMIFLYMVMLPMDMFSFTKLVGIPPDFDGVKILWMLFQIFCHFYITYTFFTSVKDQSLEFLLLRESNKKDFFDKIIVISIFTIVIRTLIHFVIYFLLFSNLLIPISLYFIHILIYLGVTFIAISFVYIHSKIF